ncbi:cation:proton antiporter [Diaphorobacter ruginosibacter]|jgi:multicomponent K+:H+ antiporter subunit G|uniref:Cation:proton antiporter n=1 Tax=Diaphorobacter ruginosibacter TaxID=1715720 RepID=A0A7G9RJ05_9BURK|nr:monovalent cation/H(+) antiporter subunit G [Diaphorobacter ruginosibacter]MDR2332559.1 monovalent cation/H(+) antiporter subunit G [Burkholderiaceae bacterium]QNN55580.1 cation:proton antiporter [Diaphorobacter ruginosibacter]
MTEQILPLWLDIFISAVVVLGALVALIGSSGLLRLKTYFERVHAPSIIATLATWCVMHATVIYFSVQEQKLAIHALLIAIFIAVTVPVTTIFLMRAALFRARRSGEKVPPSLSENSESRAQAAAVQCGEMEPD